MHLTPHEQERLLVHVAADVARRRRERGLPLNYPEVMALLTAHVYEEARAGATVDSVMESGRHVLRRGDVMDGVPEMITHVQVEATFPDGTKLVTLHDPFDAAATEVDVHPGKTEPLPDEDEYRVAFNEGSTPVPLHVSNPSDRPIQVGSHFHFAEVNEELEFPREAAHGMRLHIPSGTSERFEPGDERTVSLVPVAGDRIVGGLRAGKSEEEKHLDARRDR
ncbi:urease subunit gamma [Streptomyces hirsutus]|uniref:urease n=1 Tax=Streptomyces hirsutus TaxID=35620 RepID=A0ABZ1GTK4_9ACTN|nr:urease subunit gamma [Streptomyces hirsutus]WSD09502.1 urease subunit gamma [Streptomyces hirsutus]WTD17048.1 urease subunit gamma [Streptomyces hirsutus]